MQNKTNVRWPSPDVSSHQSRISCRVSNHRGDSHSIRRVSCPAQISDQFSSYSRAYYVWGEEGRLPPLRV